MRILMNVTFPTSEFNAALKNGSASRQINRILEECNPESVYFTEADGQRAALVVLNLESPSDIPRLAEPWFLSFGAKVHFQVVMSPEDLKKSGLDDLGRKWS